MNPLLDAGPPAIEPGVFALEERADLLRAWLAAWAAFRLPTTEELSDPDRREYQEGRRDVLLEVLAALDGQETPPADHRHRGRGRTAR